MKADVYARISHDDAKSGLGVSRQEADCRAYAKRRKWTVEVVHIDNDISASRYSRKPRPAFSALMERLATGQATRVVVWDLDRLLRQPRQLEDLIDMTDTLPIEVHNLNGDLNLNTGDGKFIARVLAAKAAKESDDASRRIKRKQLELAEAGRPAGGGRRPFGFKPDRFHHDPVEAPALKRAARFVIEGGTLQGACDLLSAAGVFPVSGEWDPPTLRRMLVSPRVAGLRQHQGKIVGEAAWKPIIDRDDWLTLRAELNSRYRYVRPYRAHLLTGLAVCGGCGHDLAAQVRKRNGETLGPDYSCRKPRGGCGSLNVNGRHLESTVVDEVGGWFTDPKMARRVTEALAGRTEPVDTAALDADRALIAELAEMVAASEITLAEWRTARAPAVERVAAAETAEAAARSTTSLAPITVDELAATWADLDRSAVKAVLRVLVARVVVAPVGKSAHRFNPDRVQVVPVWD